MCRVCVCSSAYFLRPGVFTVHRFVALCLGVVMGRFVPLPGKAFFLGRTSTSEEEVEEEEDEEEEELLPSSEDAELPLLLATRAGASEICGGPPTTRHMDFRAVPGTPLLPSCPLKLFYPMP